MPVPKGAKKFSPAWEYEQAKEKWVRYDEEVSKKLTSRCKQKETSISVDNQDYKVNFNDMTVKNVNTGFQRFLRCCCTANSGDPDPDTSRKHFAWEMSENDKIWRSMPGRMVADLESAFDEYQDSKISTVNLENYAIDLATWKIVDQSTSKEYCLRRVESQATSGDQNSKPDEPKTKENSTDKMTDKKNSKSTANGTKKSSLKRPAPADKDDKLPAVRSSSKPPSKSKKTETGAGKSTLKTLIIKGKAPVDPECRAKIGLAHVYFENKPDGGDIYDCMLNQTNIQQNNNKFYLIQLLEEDNAKQYSVWLRWGRVGFTGQTNLINCGSNLDLAKKTFCDKFYDKTRNHWSERHNFEKVYGKYDLIKVDYSFNDQKADKESHDKKKNLTTADRVNKKELPASKLDGRLQALLTMICDLKAMEQTVKEMQYDADKAPLGKLTREQIKAGYEALKKIESLLTAKKSGGGASSSQLAQACSEFYTRIPHSFGMKVPPLINDKIVLKQKLDLLDTLSDIEVAIRVLNEEREDASLHPLDKHYESLHCQIEPLDHSSQEFSIVEKYLNNTHASTHNMYTMKVLDVLRCAKEGEDARFMKHLGNRMLLWHGSRLSNWYGIISQGLRVAPPEAPCTGYMFGKGIYFADCSSKSTNYCFASKSKNIGIAVLCEVALGKCNELLAANYNADKLPTGFNSTKGLGKVVPDENENLITEDGYVVPLGRLKDAVDKNSPLAKKYSLNYNEYIVYDTTQIKMRYLVKIEFAFA